MKYKYGFIGVGNIATAIAHSLIESGAVASDRVTMYDVNASRTEPFAGLGANAAVDGREVSETSEYVIIAVQPYQMKDCLTGLREADIKPETVIVSIAASVPTSFVTETLGRKIGVIRLMPNIAMLIGKGATAAARNEFVPDERFESFVDDLRRISVVSVMDESLLNPVVSVNGSAPAYVYLLVRSMLEGAERQGISRDIAEPLILQTIEGAVGMIRRENKPIEVLIKNVCSPGGTTLAAMSSFEGSDFAESVSDAMMACTRRADEMTAALLEG